MKKKLQNFIFVLIFIAGLSLLLYPYISNEWNTYRQNQLITSYDDAIKEIDDEIDYSAEWESAYAFNNALLPAILPDSFAIAAADGEPDEEYMANLNLLGDGMMGSVEIPKINIKIPIFHTTTQEVLQISAGHLEGSSLPVGGENTHAVISAHRGLPSAALFTDLDMLKEGDHFFLHILDDILCYEVDQILIVEPEDTDALAVQSGEDLVTLLTCHPYGVNSHRLLVRGHRVEYTPEIAEQEAANNFLNPSLHTNYLLWVLIGLGITFLVIVILTIRERRIRKNMIAIKKAVEEITQAKE